MEVLAIVLVLLVLVGAICGIVAVSQQSALRRDIWQLQQQLKRLQSTSASTTAAAPAVSAEPVDSPMPLPPSPTASAPQPNVVPTPPAVSLGDALRWLEQAAMRHGMVWLGALTLSLGGIFLVRYSLDAGWVSPSVRIALGLLMGLVLLALSEWLHIKRWLSQQLTQYVPAALASAGFITLYASLLMAQQFYQLLSPSVTFGALAMVALCASWFSLRQGPILAVIGIIGAYAVPVLIDSDTSAWTLLLLYVMLVTTSSVLVERRVAVSWLWYLPMAAHLLWLLVLLTSAKETELSLWWLALVISFVGTVVLPTQGGRPVAVANHSLPLRDHWPFLREQLLGLVLAVLALVAIGGFSHGADVYALIVFMLVLYATAAINARQELWLIVSGVLACGWLWHHPADEAWLQHQAMFVVLALPLLMGIYRPYRLPWSAVAAVFPVVAMGISYHAASEDMQQSLRLGWMAYASLWVMALAALSLKPSSKMAAFIHTAGANFALTFCFTLYLSAAALTLAVAAQLVMLAVLSRQRQVLLAPWVIKAVVAVLLLRLTSAPFLGSYEGKELFGVHWSWVVYPAVLLALIWSWHFWRQSTLRAWLEGAILHVLALAITVLTQYGLMGAPLRFDAFTFDTWLAHSVNWSVLAWVYYVRRKRAGSLAFLYGYASALLLALACLAQFTLNTFYHPYFFASALGDWPVANKLLLLWGLPALLLARFGLSHASGRWRQLALISSTAFALVFVCASVRHFWQDGVILLSRPTSNAEFYSYSVVFLLLAFAAILVSHQRHWTSLRQAGFALLALVVVKVFMFDMGELQGLLRAASFIGLGVCLLLLGAWFQWLQRRQAAAFSGG